MTTYKLIYLNDGIQVLEYTNRFCSANQMREVGGKERLMTIASDGCYPRLLHVCSDGRRRTVGQYPSFTLGRDWSDGLQAQYKDELDILRRAS